jgi:hypothetical protein
MEASIPHAISIEPRISASPCSETRIEPPLRTCTRSSGPSERVDSSSEIPLGVSKYYVFSSDNDVPATSLWNLDTRTIISCNQRFVDLVEWPLDTFTEEKFTWISHFKLALTAQVRMYLPSLTHRLQMACRTVSPLLPILMECL